MENPDLKPARIWPWILLGAGVLAGLVVLVQIAHDAPPPGPPDLTEQAKVVIEDTLVAPSTVKYVSLKTIDASGNWRMVHATFDAQNTFGAMIRQNVCVIFEMKNSKITWRKDVGVQECGRDPEPDLLRVLKDANGWPSASSR